MIQFSKGPLGPQFALSFNMATFAIMIMRSADYDRANFVNEKNKCGKKIRITECCCVDNYLRMPSFGERDPDIRYYIS